MHTLEPELRTLHAEGAIDDAAASRALARDRGEVFSLHMELRATLYAGVLLTMAGVGIDPRAQPRPDRPAGDRAGDRARRRRLRPARRAREARGSRAHGRGRIPAAPRRAARERGSRLRRAAVHAARPALVVAPAAARGRARGASPTRSHRRSCSRPRSRRLPAGSAWAARSATRCTSGIRRRSSAVARSPAPR